MAIYSGFSHQKWWFSIVMLVYQRVHVYTGISYGIYDGYNSYNYVIMVFFRISCGISMVSIVLANRMDGLRIPQMGES